MATKRAMTQNFNLSIWMVDVLERNRPSLICLSPLSCEHEKPELGLLYLRSVASSSQNFRNGGFDLLFRRNVLLLFFRTLFRLSTSSPSPLPSRLSFRYSLCPRPDKVVGILEPPSIVYPSIRVEIAIVYSCAIISRAGPPPHGYPSTEKSERSTKRKPRCRTHASHQNCWTTPSTFCKTLNMRSRIAALSQNRGSRAPGSTSSPISGSDAERTWNRGRRCFQILQPLLRITPHLYTLTAPTTSQPRMQKRVVGSQVSLASSTCTLATLDQPPEGRQSLSPHSMGCHLPSNLSA